MATKVGEDDDGGEASAINVSGIGDGVVSSRQRASSILWVLGNGKYHE